ncbi:MFS transporter [Cobetia sp. Dlab-2-AX]|uniref:MFS transporter n=1 Tax=unclassified Cobetia TaxID=2609414 RepID=UPI002097A4F8|nr:MFS transporter [Cobetia sp. Dlab-2-AX]MCO7235630.1 MFS transporter [Cobetia sp. Dlab-2-U]
MSSTKSLTPPISGWRQWANRYPVALIALAQLFGTSLWFTPNAVLAPMLESWSFTSDSAAALGQLTSSVQGGFIVGTLALGLAGLADRFAARHLFMASCVLGALTNLALLIAPGLLSASGLRVLTGLALAGIYPIGLKLMVHTAPDRAGAALAWLVGMLVLGTALPHGLAALQLSGHFSLPWGAAIGMASLLAVAGAGLVALLPAIAPPARVTTSTKTSLLARATRGLAAWRHPGFVRGALGYFGHMWELYTLWALVPLLLTTMARLNDLSLSATQLALHSFLVIAVGGPGCVVGGWLSRTRGSLWVARLGLAGSVILTLLFVTAMQGDASYGLLLGLLALWSLMAVIDSPQFSALAAGGTPVELQASALAVMNAIGFSLSLVSIALLTPLVASQGSLLLLAILPGPLLGLLALARRVDPA